MCGECICGIANILQSCFFTRIMCIERKHVFSLPVFLNPGPRTGICSPLRSIDFQEPFNYKVKFFKKKKHLLILLLYFFFLLTELGIGHIQGHGIVWCWAVSLKMSCAPFSYRNHQEPMNEPQNSCPSDFGKEGGFWLCIYICNVSVCQKQHEVFLIVIYWY